MHKFTKMQGVSVTLAGCAEMQERADMRSAEGLEDRMLTPGQVEALKVVLKVSWLTLGAACRASLSGTSLRFETLLIGACTCADVTRR